jgi:predicted dehydrogenase
MKIGILGFGSMGKTHLYAVRNIPFFFSGEHNYEATYVCTSKIETAKAEDLFFDFYHENHG